METAKNTKNLSNKERNQLPRGVYAIGMVVSADLQDKEYEGREYQTMVATITDGEKRSFLYQTSREPIPKLRFGQEVKIDVRSARMEGKMLRIDGQLEILNDLM